MTGQIEEHAKTGHEITQAINQMFSEENPKLTKKLLANLTCEEKWVPLSDAKEHINIALQKADANYKAYEELDAKFNSFREYLEKGYGMANIERRIKFPWDEVMKKFDELFAVEAIASQKCSSLSESRSEKT